MIMSLIVGLTALAFLTMEVGVAFIEQTSLTIIIYYLLVNLAFVLATGSKKRYLEMLRLTFKSVKESAEKKADLMSLNTYLIAINIIFSVIVNIIIKISMYGNLSDPSSIGAFSSYSLIVFLYVLLFIAFILIPQRYILSNSVTYITSEGTE